MFNKRGILIGIFLIILITLVYAQNPPAIPSSAAGKSFGEINPRTGLPDKLDKFKEMGDYFVQSEQNKSFLTKEWTKLAAKNPVLGPFLFYTDKFFSFFDFLWQYSFGMKFSWSGEFFIHFAIWFVITWIVFLSIKDAKILGGVFSFITGMIVASITGSLGIISFAFKLIDTIVNDMLGLTILAVLIILFLIVYDKVMRKFQKESEKEKLERADKNRLTAGEVSEKVLEKLEKD